MDIVSNESNLKELCKEFSRLDTAAVSDALDRLGLRGAFLGIKPVVGGEKICGPATTLRYIPIGLEFKGAGDYIDDVPEGNVIVIDNGGRLDCTVWGDILSLSATLRKCAGTVIDGVCRDVPAIKKLNYPMFSKGCYMVTGKDRIQLESVNVPVSICSVNVSPGDIILGDDSGVLAIPRERAEDVLKAAKEIEEKEQDICRYVESGMPLVEARIKIGYDLLQRRQ